jgi:hypothetical protein
MLYLAIETTAIPLYVLSGSDSQGAIRRGWHQVPAFRRNDLGDHAVWLSLLTV